MASDITVRKHTEKALSAARSRLEATLAAGEVGTWQWDLQRDELIADANMAAIFNLSDEQAASAPSAVYLNEIHPDDVDGVALEITTAIEGMRPYHATYRVRRPCGDYRWVIAQGRVEADGAGAPARLPGIVIDITRQREAEEKLRRTQERYSKLIESMDDGFCVIQMIVDSKGAATDYCFLEVNPAFALHTGLTDAAGKTIRELVPDIEPSWIELYGRVAVSGDPVRIEEQSGALQRWFSIYAVRVGEEVDRTVAVLFRDITDRRTAEAELRSLAADLSNENRRKTEFLATLAHELRNPLAPIRTGLDLLQLTGKNPSAVTKVHEMMGRQLNQMVHLIDDLLDIARINSGKVQLRMEAVELREAVSSAIEAALPQIEAAQHTLDVSIPECSLLIHADPTRLTQIVANLLSNAAKYTPNGGKIQVAAYRESSFVKLEVSDTGIGIPAEALDHVFDMFTQVSRNMGRSQGGLGIGLSLVRSLAQMHGGTVTAHSAGQGLGSTFTVRLPLVDSSLRGLDLDQATSAERIASTRRLNILIADDNVDAGNTLLALLQVCGHTVEIVRDGQQAVDQALIRPYDLIILDIGMPGLDGYEVADAIRRSPQHSDTFLAALTGWGSDDDRTRSRRAGFDAHLTKPADLTELNGVIDQCLGLR